MKALKLVAVIIAVILGVSIPSAVLAGNTATMINKPRFSGGISNFVITYVNDNQMDMIWAVGIGVSNVMIMANYGAYPLDIPNNTTAPNTVPNMPSTEYEVYYGSGLSATDNLVDMSFNSAADISDNSNTPFTVYYSAWAQKLDGTWYMIPSTGSEESRDLLFVGVMGIIIIFTVIAFIFKNALLHMVAMIAWIVGAVILYNQNYNFGNTYIPVALAVIALAMVLVHVVMFVGLITNMLKNRPHPLTYDQEKLKQQNDIYNRTRRKPRW
jgi:hypothetical protein